MILMIEWIEYFLIGLEEIWKNRLFRYAIITLLVIFMLIIFHVLLFYELNYIFIPKIIVFFFICITIYQISKNMDVSLAFFHRFEKYFNKKC